MKAGVVITTKNRKESLHHAIRSALAQKTLGEIIVIDDGSTDGTSEFVRTHFPTVILHKSCRSLGLVVQRNRAARLSSADVIVSIDDDAVFSSPSVIEQTLSAFDHARVAAVAIPYVEPHKGKEIFQNAPDDKRWVTDSFRGTAYAVLRREFLKIGGFREKLFHQGEERDLCIRLLQQGKIVRLGYGDFVVHNEAPRRDWKRMHFYGRRNDILFAWNNVPTNGLVPHLAGTTLKGLRLASYNEKYKYDRRAHCRLSRLPW